MRVAQNVINIARVINIEQPKTKNAVEALHRTYVVMSHN